MARGKIDRPEMMINQFSIQLSFFFSAVPSICPPSNHPRSLPRFGFFRFINFRSHIVITLAWRGEMGGKRKERKVFVFPFVQFDKQVEKFFSSSRELIGSNISLACWIFSFFSLARFCPSCFNQWDDDGYHGRGRWGFTEGRWAHNGEKLPILNLLFLLRFLFPFNLFFVFLSCWAAQIFIEKSEEKFVLFKRPW